MTSVEFKSAEPILAHKQQTVVLARGWDWTKRLSAVGGTQALVQSFNFASGILIVRWLPTEQYALYTLANTLLSTLSAISDGGISSGVIAQGGKVWQDPAKLGSVIATGFSLRRWFAVGSVLIAGPVLVYLLRTHGASWSMSVILFAAVAANFWFCALGSIYNVAPALHQRLSLIQRIAAVQGIARVVGLALAVIAIPTALMALVPTIVAQAWASLRLRLATFQIAASAQAADPQVKAGVFRVVRRVLPSAIYMSLSSQLSIWLISICGTTDAVARLGALGRLGQAFAIFSTFAAAVFVPRFARLPADKPLLRRRYVQTLLLIGSVGGVCVGVVALFPRAALWILGGQYQGLAEEVVLQAICSLLWFVSAIAYSLSAVRGFAIRPQVSIPLQILGQVCLVALLDLSSVKGLLWMGILIAAWQIVIYLADTTIQIGKLEGPTGLRT